MCKDLYLIEICSISFMSEVWKITNMTAILKRDQVGTWEIIGHLA